MTSPTPALPTALQAPGFAVPGRVQANLTEPALIEAALARGEGQLGQGGAFLVSTGQFTGRSPKDKYIVRTAEVEPLIWWENNQPMSPGHFAQLQADMQAHLQGRECFVQDLCAGADPSLRLDLRMVTELAWHGLFMRHMLRVPDPGALAGFKPQWTIVNCPSFRADPLRHGCRSETVIALNFAERLVLIGGTGYAGENKKAVFTILNHLLPGQDVLPMHCAANHAPGDPDDVAIFFGLSGTGKTSLSAAPDRVLIGDDEHGWSARGVFNFEGGCYAKTLNLSPQAEPQIHAATTRFASVVENMVFDPQTRALDFADGSLSENTRCAYPLQAISNASRTGMGGAPRHVVLLTCDAFGVLPPIARLTPAQAMYHFLSGFTARTPGTERGVVAPVPVFSACFGAPFMPRRPEVYGAMLQRRIAESGAACWLVNTGWTGGAHGTGQRMPIAATRRVLDAALSGSLGKGRFRKDPVFGFEVPRSVPGLDDALLTPRATWADPAAYDAQAARLVAMFSDNFAQYLPFMDAEVRAAAIG